MNKREIIIFILKNLYHTLFTENETNTQNDCMVNRIRLHL